MPVSASVTFVAGASPLGAALHGDFYYWIDFQTRQLERAALDSGTREALSSVFHGGPMTATDDAVYWSDTSLGTVEMWTAAGGRVELTPEGDPGELVFADGYLYWSQGWVTGGSLRRIDPNGGELETVLCGISDPGPPYLVDGYLVVNTDEGIFRVDR